MFLWASVSDKKWTDLDAAHHRAHTMRLLDGLEVIAREKRLKVARAILYMAQGQCKSCSQHKIKTLIYFFCAFLLHASHQCLRFVLFFSGTFAECSCEAEVQYWMRYNIFLLLDVGTFSALVELLNMEIEYDQRLFNQILISYPQPLRSFSPVILDL